MLLLRNTTFNLTQETKSGESSILSPNSMQTSMVKIKELIIQGIF